MSIMRNFVYILLGLLIGTLAALGGEVKPDLAQPKKFYADAGLSLRTEDFTKATYGYFVGVGYQVTPIWGFDARIAHQGLDAEGSAVQDLGTRIVARLPFEYLQPYTFLGARFDLERDNWHLEPGLGVQYGMLFAEAGLDADLHGHSGYKFGAGLRFRF